MTKKQARRHFTAEQKAAILKRHLIDKVPVSDLSDEHQLQPSVIYEWQRRLMDNAAVALEPDRADKVSKGRERQLEDKVGRLEAKLAKKDTVMAELLAEYVALKNAGGEP
jgi:transposase-like protein